MGKSSTILAFDVGGRRIGVAIAHIPPRFAEPLTTLIQNDDLHDEVEKLIEEHRPDMLIVGYPRNMNGEPTGQTKKTKAWVNEYLTPWQLPLYWQDESLTSVAAATELHHRGKKHTKEDVDALAANIILTDFLENRKIGA